MYIEGLAIFLPSELKIYYGLVYAYIQVDWCPYSNISHTVVPENILNTLILGRSKTMLICFDKAERHLPDRVLRQFGMNQTIPQEVQRWERKSRGVDGGVDLSAKMESELNEWSNCHLHVVEAEEYVKESAYMQWYWNITRRLVGRPIPISSEFQRMVNLHAILLHLQFFAVHIFRSTSSPLYSVSEVKINKRKSQHSILFSI